MTGPEPQAFAPKQRAVPRGFWLPAIVAVLLGCWLVARIGERSQIARIGIALAALASLALLLSMLVARDAVPLRAFRRSRRKLLLAFVVLAPGDFWALVAHQRIVEREAHCRDSVRELLAFKRQPPPSTEDEIKSWLAKLDATVSQGSDACRRADLRSEIEIFQAARDGSRDARLEVERQVAAQRARQYRSVEAGRPAAAAPDEARSGGANAAANNDDADIRQRCHELDAAWSGRGVTVARCYGPRPPIDHILIRVAVEESGWEALGASQSLFLASALQTFGSHWRRYHGWNGHEGPYQIEVVHGLSEGILAQAWADGRLR